MKSNDPFFTGYSLCEGGLNTGLTVNVLASMKIIENYSKTQ